VFHVNPSQAVIAGFGAMDEQAINASQLTDAPSSAGLDGLVARDDFLDHDAMGRPTGSGSPVSR
jgi:hypothetical protein